MKPIPLNKIVDELEMQNNSLYSFLNKETGEIVTVFTEVLEDEEYDYEYDQEKYAKLPDCYDINEYIIMEKFCYTLENDDMMNELLDAIRGRGAFSRFRNRIQRMGVEEDWYQYRFQTYRRIAISWCENKSIPYSQ